MLGLTFFQLCTYLVNDGCIAENWHFCRIIKVLHFSRIGVSLSTEVRMNLNPLPIQDGRGKSKGVSCQKKYSAFHWCHWASFLAHKTFPCPFFEELQLITEWKEQLKSVSTFLDSSTGLVWAKLCVLHPDRASIVFGVKGLSCYEIVIVSCKRLSFSGVKNWSICNLFSHVYVNRKKPWMIFQNIFRESWVYSS